MVQLGEMRSRLTPMYAEPNRERGEAHKICAKRSGGLARHDTFVMASALAHLSNLFLPTNHQQEF